MPANARTAMIVTTVHNPCDNRIFLKQVMSLRKAGWNIEYLCRKAGSPDDEDGLKVIPISLPEHRLLRVIAGNFVLAWKGLFSVACVLHVHDPELFLMARLLGWRFRRVVIDLHELPHEQVRYKPYLRESVKRPLSRLVELALRVILYRATVVVAESSYIEWVSKSAARTVLVRNFPAISDLPPLQGREKRDSKKFRLGYVGMISRARHMDQVAASLPEIAARIGRKTTLRLIGTFDSPTLKAEVLACDGIEYLDFRPNDEARQLLADVDIGISLTARTPNYDYSLSTKILEYLLIGLPVVASDNPINRELFADFQAVRLVDPGSREAFVAAVVAFHDTPPDVSLLKDSRRRVHAEMNWNVEFQRLLEMYETVLEERVQ